jgi:flavin reductase (DIM6/NTAB) family NADH-FMN oxidoreductase RutF
MDKTTSEGVGIFAQHYPRVTAILTSRAGEKTNAMTVAWHTPVSFSPPLYCLAVGPKRYSYKLISNIKEFAINFMPAEFADAIAAVGGIDGQQLDKLHEFRLSQDRPVKTSAPILHAAYAAYECKLIDDHAYGDHRLLIGQIMAVHWAKEVFMEDGSLDLTKVAPVMYLGNEHYISTDYCTIRTIEREFCVDCYTGKT